MQSLTLDSPARIKQLKLNRFAPGLSEMHARDQVVGVNRESVIQLGLRDPVLGRLMSRIGPVELVPRRFCSFRAVLQAVIFQQLNGKVAIKILDRFLRLFSGKDFPSPEEVLAAGLERLRTAGLSTRKCSCIIGIAGEAVARRLPTLEECDRLSDAEIIDALTRLKGVGRWTAEMFLIFNLGRPDVLPARDLGVRYGFKKVYHKRSLPSPSELERFGERWAPYRTTATLYLWRATDSAGGAGW